MDLLQTITIKQDMMMQVAVTDPQRVGDGITSFMTYKVNTSSDGPGLTVVRRYNQFVWLRAQLSRAAPGAIVPPLPDKTVASKYNFEPSFIEMRRRGLERFLLRVAAHAELSKLDCMRTFLAATDADLLEAIRRSQPETDLAQTTKKSFGGLLDWGSTQVQAAMAGAPSGGSLAESKKTSADKKFDDALDDSHCSTTYERGAQAIMHIRLSFSYIYTPRWCAGSRSNASNSVF